MKNQYLIYLVDNIDPLAGQPEIQIGNLLNVNPTMKANIAVSMLTAAKTFVYHKLHITKAMMTIVASKPILIVENLQPVTMAISSTHPSPGRGAMSAGM